MVDTFVRLSALLYKTHTEKNVTYVYTYNDFTLIFVIKCKYVSLFFLYKNYRATGQMDKTAETRTVDAFIALLQVDISGHKRTKYNKKI